VDQQQPPAGRANVSFSVAHELFVSCSLHSATGVS
jgi:hypothetical protein